MIKAPNFATGMFFRTHFMLQTACYLFKIKANNQSYEEEILYLLLNIKVFVLKNLYHLHYLILAPLFFNKMFPFPFHSLHYLFIFLSIYIFLCIFMYLSIYLSICLSTAFMYLFIYLFIPVGLLGLADIFF